MSVGDIELDVVLGTPIIVDVTEGTPIEISLGEGGPAGDPGPPGPPGTGQPFEYVQSVPASSWTIPHNLGYRPAAVTVFDTTDNEVETGVRNVDLNTIEITMVSPMAGRVEIA